jgi:predicted  nucleic acid-binding Zn-ribbon protein
MSKALAAALARVEQLEGAEQAARIKLAERETHASQLTTQIAELEARLAGIERPEPPIER